MNEFINFTKKNSNLLIVVCIVISFNLIAHTLWSNYFCPTGTTTATITVESAKTGNISPILTGKQPLTTVKLSTKPKAIETATGGESKEVSSGQSEYKVGGVMAGYDGETTYERTRNQLIKLGLSYEIAEHITREAYTNTEDPKLFIKNIIGVSNAEGGIFKHGLYNNYLGVMARKADGSYGLRHYDTVQLAITHWREMYNRNKWYVRTTAQRWLDGNYCASSCSFRIQNYNAGIYLLNI